MSTKMIARGIVGSVRLAGVTAAVAAGIAGFATVSATPASAASSAEQGNVPDKACQNMDRANVPLAVYLKHGCLVIPDEGEITGGSIFS
jgi:hypothetical protein